MTTHATIMRLLKCPSLETHAPALPAGLEALPIPRSHRAFLGVSDGFMGFGGFFRVFSAARVEQRIGIDSWNEVETWKFAWPEPVRTFLCFGETAWGDQYAYSVDDLRNRTEPPVYVLDALTMAPEKLCESFDAFLVEELLRNCVDPYDNLVVGARERLGDLLFTEHVVFAPSPLITGVESLDHVVKMRAVDAMIVNGDVASQMTTDTDNLEVLSVSTYVDAKGRARVRVNWGDRP